MPWACLLCNSTPWRGLVTCRAWCGTSLFLCPPACRTTAGRGVASRLEAAVGEQGTQTFPPRLQLEGVHLAVHLREEGPRPASMQPRCVTAGWPAASSSWRCRGLLTPPTAAVGAAPGAAPANSGGCPVPTQPRRAQARDAGACCAASSAEHAGRCAGKARNRHGGPRLKRSPARLAKASGAARAAGRLSVSCLRTDDVPRANKCVPYAFPVMTSCRAGGLGAGCGGRCVQAPPGLA